ncbi:MAG: alpha/beta fold hydrolase [Planctomycetota bacterium]|nr:alpha/beta fold hydrolase [Planctomycetota bacterium]
MLTSLVLAASAAITSPSASAAIASSLPVAEIAQASSTVSFKTKDKLILKGSYFAPKKSKSKSKAAPAALLIHDAGSDRSKLDSVAGYLQKRGFAVLVVDLRGHGESADEDSVFETADEKDRETMWSLSSRDVDAAAEFLVDQEGVHSTNLSLVGFGAGASLAVRRAAADDNVRALVLVNPTRNNFGYNLVNGVAELGGLPTLIVAPKDRRDDARRLQAAAHEKSDGLEFVEISNLKSEAAKVLSDKRLNAGLGKWLRDQAVPKK